MLVIDLVNGITVISFVCTMISIMYQVLVVSLSQQKQYLSYSSLRDYLYIMDNDTANLSAMKGFISYCSNFITMVKS